MASVEQLTAFTAYADRFIEKRRLNSSLFSSTPLLTVMAGKGGTDGALGRPGTGTLIGGGNISRANQESMSGSYERHIRFLTGKVGGGKNLGARDTVPSTGNDSHDQHVRSAVFRWARHMQPIKVWNTTVLLSKGKFEIANAIEEATQMAMEEQMEVIHQQLFTGNPADQTADIWSSILGLEQCMHTTNNYGNTDRTTYTTWAGRRVTTAKTADLDLIDDANLIQGVKNKGPGLDLAITTNAIYKKLKKQALANGGQLLVRGMPEMKAYGQLKEAVNYNGVTVIPDPLATSAYFYGLTLDDWLFETHSDANWKVTPFKDQSENPGGDDAVTAQIHLMYRLSCRKPWNQILYTNVS